MVNASPSDIGDAPLSFSAARVYSDCDGPSGAAFVDVFKNEHRPFSEYNVALLYVIGPCLDPNSSAQDFLSDIFKTGENLMQLVLDYNYRADSDQELPRIQVLRLPILGHVGKTADVTPKHVALAMLWGIHSTLSTSSDQCSIELQLLPDPALREAYELYSAGAIPADWDTPESKNIYELLPALFEEDDDAGHLQSDVGKVELSSVSPVPEVPTKGRLTTVAEQIGAQVLAEKNEALASVGSSNGVADSAVETVVDVVTGEETSAFKTFPMTFASAQPGSFAASYEKTPTSNFAFLVPGDEELFLGGGALNGAVGKLLLEHAAQPIAFERDTQGNYVMEQDAGTGRDAAKFDKNLCLYRKVHETIFQKARAKRNSMAIARPNDLDKAPFLAFCAARTYSDCDRPFGTVFLDIFKREHRPFSEKNVALLYAVGALGCNRKAEGEGVVDPQRAQYVKTDVRDFLEELFKTGANLMQLVLEYNCHAEYDPDLPAVEVLRLPILSGGVFIHPDVTPREVALALIWGVHSALLSALDPSSCVKIELMPGNDMRGAYDLYRTGATPRDWKTTNGKRSLFRRIPLHSVCPDATDDEASESDDDVAHNP